MKDLHQQKNAIEFYNERYEHGYMEEWDDLKKNKVKEILGLIQLPERGKALDFGCGNGVFTQLIKEAFPQWDVFGVEISQVAVQNAKKKYPQCTFFSIDKAASYQHQFDFLFSHHVLEHVQNIDEALATINDYLKENASQLHILPCGNEGSFEYQICSLKTHGIETTKENRFFFEEPGHLRRLNTKQLSDHEAKIGFRLEKEFYSNQIDGAINWITKSSPRFVKKLTSPDDAKNDEARKKLIALRKKLLPLTYMQFPYSKYWEIKTKWHKTITDYLKLYTFYFPSLLSKSLYETLDKKAQKEWVLKKTNRNGSEMFLYFKR